MADIMCDFTHTNNGDGDGWADQVGAGGAKNTLQLALDAAGAGGRVFYRGPSAQSSQESYGTSQLLISPGTILAPTLVYGVAPATSATPPTDSDLLDKTSADLPIFKTTTASDNISVKGFAEVYGIELSATKELLKNDNVSGTWYFENCNIIIGTITSPSRIIVGRGGSEEVDSSFIFLDTDITFSNLTDVIILDRGGSFIWRGGTLIAPNNVTVLFTNGQAGRAEIKGVDLTAIGSGKTLVSLSSSFQFDILVANCKIPGTLALVSGTWNGHHGKVRVHGCSTATGISTSVRDAEEDTYAGNLIIDTTHVRTGGADDGAAGQFAFALTPNANAVMFPNSTLRSPPMYVWLDGDETSIKVYIANDAAESSPANDMHDDEVWAEVFFPDSAIDTTQYGIASDRKTPLATAVDQANDAGSTWGSGANNHQTLDVTISAGYEGWAEVYVHCAERAASPKTVYVDPLPVAA